MNRKYVKLAFAFFMIFHCATSEVYTRKDINYSKYKRIAVFPLADYPYKPGSGLQIADMLSTQLLNSDYNIIDRTQITLILQEQALSLSGVIDENTAPSIGKLLGVQAILTGSVNEFQCVNTNIQMVQGAAPAYMAISSAGISLKLIDCETGQIVWAGSARGTELGQNVEIMAAQKAIKDILKKFTNIDSGIRQKNFQTHEKQTVLPNFRMAFPKYDKYSDEQIIQAFRNKNPDLKDRSDIWIIKYIETKYKNK